MPNMFHVEHQAMNHFELPTAYKPIGEQLVNGMV